MSIEKPSRAALALEAAAQREALRALLPRFRRPLDTIDRVSRFGSKVARGGPLPLVAVIAMLSLIGGRRVARVIKSVAAPLALLRFTVPLLAALSRRAR